MCGYEKQMGQEKVDPACHNRRSERLPFSGLGYGLQFVNLSVVSM